MAIKKKVAKKKVAKRKVAKKKAVVSKSPDIVASLREQLKAAKDENRELKKAVTAGDRSVAALLKLLGSAQTDVTRFMSGKVKDAVKKYEISLKPKKRRRKAKKKAAAKK